MLLEMSELYPLGPETSMSRALPPVEVHLTLNVDVPVTTSIAAVTVSTGGEECDRTSVITAKIEGLLLLLCVSQFHCWGTSSNYIVIQVTNHEFSM